MSEPEQTLQIVMDTTPGSLRELAREAGVSHSLVSQIQNGKRNATTQTLDALAAALERWSYQCQVGAKRLQKKMEDDK